MKNIVNSLFYIFRSSLKIALRITCFLSISVGFFLVNQTLTAQPVELGRCSLTQQEEPEIRTPDFHGWDPLGADCAWFNEFKRDISKDPTDPHSDEMLKRLLDGNGHVWMQWSGSWTPPEWNWYTFPFQVVSGNTEPVTIPAIWKYNPDSSGPYMLPPEPIVYEGSTDTTYPTSPWTDGGDHHLVVFVRDEETGGFKELWEYYQPWITWDGDQISAVEGASWRRFDLKNGENPPPGTGATDAAGMMIMPLCVRYDEVASGEINHALRFCVNNSDISPTFKWPARSAANAWNPETGMPYGTRLRIKASWWDENADSAFGIGTQARIIGEAIRRYGLLLADGSVGTSLQLQGVADLRWETDLENRLNSIPVSALEVVQTPPLLHITGPTELEVGETGTWILTLLPEESTVGKGSNINIYDGEGNLLQYKFAVIDEDNRSDTSQFTFDEEGYIQ